MHIKKRIRLHVTIEQNSKKKKHTQSIGKLVETVGQRYKRLDIPKQPNVSLKISIRNTAHLKTKAQCHLFPSNWAAEANNFSRRAAN